ncbi:MAG: hypothetical protein K8I00_10165 [Candidatus Omnitrophica bacterium]|nr:hypothetical protein [Candidatus Omnitrophota bacterium]
MKRSKRAVEAGMKQGIWCLGSTTIPYGYRKGVDKRLEINPEAKKYYDLIVSWALDGLSMLRIARRLEELEVPTKHSTAGRRFRWHEIWCLRGNAGARRTLERFSLSHNLAFPDALVAATVKRAGLTLLTGNRQDYTFISGLKIRTFKP